MIRLKAQELANFILGTRTDLDFDEPKPILHRTDSEAIRNQITSMTSIEATKLGIRRNTLWYLQQRARNEVAFKMYSKVRTKVRQAT